MELIERYLQAVRFWLPKKQQDDIIAELSEDLRTQVEEREAELGRILNEAEIEDLLRRRGSPIRVANGYLSQRSLIGPALFPVYAFVLKVVTIASLLWWCVARIIGQVIAHGAHADWLHVFAGTIRPLCMGWLFSAGITTLVFAICEHTSVAARIFAWWNPRHLPPLRSANSIPRPNSILAISGLACLLVFWVLEMTPPLSIRLWTFRMEMASGWSFVFWAVLAVCFGSLILAVTNLLRPWWTTSRAVMQLILRIVGAAIFCWFLQAQLVAGFAWRGATPENAAHATAQINLWLAHFFPWAVAIEVMIVAYDVWRVIKVHRYTPSMWNPIRNPL